MEEKAEKVTMNAEPDLSKVVLWSTYLASEPDDRDLIEMHFSDAKGYLQYFDWCLEIQESYIGMLYPGILAVFLFRIVPGEKADEWIWIIVGDLPPAYLTVDICPNPATALDGYIGAMQEWVDAAFGGKSVADLIPVNVPATREYAELLQSRLEFLDERILSEYQDDLTEFHDDLKA